MSEKCGKCQVDVTGSSVIATCIECKTSFHTGCTRIGSSQNITKAKLKSWKCDLCKDDTSSMSSIRSTEENEDKKTILEALKTMKSDLSTQISGVQGSISVLSEDMKKINSKVLAVEEEQARMNIRLNKIDKTTSHVSEEVRRLKSRLSEAEQRSRVANVEIQGLPRTNGEDVYYALSLIAKAIGVTYNRDDISIAHRLKRVNSKLGHPPLIVQFMSRSVKEVWCRAARAKKNLKSTDIEPSFQSSLVYFNDHLTNENKVLLGRARRLLREKKICFATYTNGKILIKRREGDDLSRVTDMEDLDWFDK